MRIAGLALVAATLTLVVQTLPAAAKTCKEPLSVTSRSTIKTTEAARTKRATDNAEKKWSKEARAKFGLQYQLWMRSDAQKIECRQTEKSSICVVTATPCSIL